MPNFRDRYQVSYPLRDRGMDRDACRRMIKRHNLPLPPKSACFFCPAMKQQEIQRLAVVDPDFYALAIELERLYRDGHHFRGDDAWVVRGKVPGGETLEFVCKADSAADARAQFRKQYHDEKRPYKYKVSCSRAVPGLGRSFAWKDVELVQLQ